MTKHEKFKDCRICTREMCENIRSNTSNYFTPVLDSNFRYIADGINFNVDTPCLGTSDEFFTLVEHGITTLLASKDIIVIFDYILNDFKDLRLEDAIKITNLRNKQLKFIASKKEEKKC